MSVRVPRAMIKFFSRLFIPTGNKRLNELVGFLLFVSAILLLLALASYSPLDPSFNTASTASAAHPAQNWIGLAGALLADVLFQYIGISVFLVPVYFGMFGQRCSVPARSNLRERRRWARLACCSLPLL